MRVADLGHMEARVDVNENDVVNVKFGQKATIISTPTATGSSKEQFSRSLNTGKTTGAGTQEEVTNFEVKIRIDVHDVSLRPSLSCRPTSKRTW